ncbi:TPA: helix-turn-helix transcriptional regulator [Yersinia enterocolitica]|nr:transcriptional regulator [Yersinia enterocolitica]HDM8277074.1 helix-turn-helix transcriptional regulator [Yersinia enterocolitica]
MEGTMKLSEYLNRNSISQKTFATSINASQGYVSHIVVGRHAPRGIMAINIAAATQWAVTPHELNATDYPNPTDGLPPEHQCTAPAA